MLEEHFEQIKAILEKTGIWEYFIFPSIDWNPKGPRLAQLIDDAQLRAPTVLFIDDNHMNREEAKHFVPALQVADENIIPTLLSSPLLQGKDDRDLTRLKQYKLIESKIDQQKAPVDIRDFLRQSDIRVDFHYNIGEHVDRFIERVNRTNQLNFTKRRLPEEPDAARAAVHQLLDRTDLHMGLISVKDRFRDYGFVGAFVANIAMGKSHLMHFCFSCRTLNMEVEAWVYNRLGRPTLKTIGAEVSLRVPEVRHGVSVLREHSVFLRYALTGLSERERAELAALGFEPQDLSFELLGDGGGGAIWILQFSSDPGAVLYKHRTLGVMAPVALKCLPNGSQDLIRADIAEVPAATFADTVEKLMTRAPKGTRVFVLTNAEFLIDGEGNRRQLDHKIRGHKMVCEIFSRYPYAKVLSLMDFVQSDADFETQNPNHVSRDFYSVSTST